MRNAILFAGLIAILWSCDEEYIHPVFNNSAFYKAHQSNDWDSLSIRNNLIGSWNWVYVDCCPEGTRQAEGRWTINECYNLEIGDSTLDVYSKGELIGTSAWELYSRGKGYYGIETNPRTGYLWGDILFSKDKVLFHNTPADGADNYFERISLTD